MLLSVFGTVIDVLFSSSQKFPRPLLFPTYDVASLFSFLYTNIGKKGTTVNLLKTKQVLKKVSDE